MNLNAEKAVIVTAEQLGLGTPAEPVTAIIDFCIERIQKWIRETHFSGGIRELEQLVCRKLGVTIIEAWTDDDLSALVVKYMRKGDIAFASVTQDLSGDTFGVLIRRRGVRSNAKDRYVAVIDCRGQKATRRFFTRWHEIAHVLTDYKQLEFKRLFRAPKVKDPLESLVDVVAGTVGFYDPLFNPIFSSEFSRESRLSLDGVDRIRRRYCDDASFEATLNASIQRVPYPVIAVEAGLAFKKSELKSLPTNGIKDTRPPVPRLRVLKTLRNEAARSIGLLLHPKMAVPESSLLTQVFSGMESDIFPVMLHGTEDLATWKHSDGSAPSTHSVDIEARRMGKVVYAILSQPTSSSAP